MDSALADFTRFASTILSAFGVEDRGSKDKLDVDDIEDQFALENIDFEAKKLAAMVRMRIHCFDIPKM